MASTEDPVNIPEDGEDIDAKDIIEETDDEVESLETSPAPDTTAAKGKGKMKAGLIVAKKITKKTRSFVWDHYTRLKNNHNKCCCNYCGKKMSCASSSGTSNLRKHILACKKYLAWKATTSASQHVLNEEADGLHLRKVSESFLREAANEMLVIGELPLSFIDSLAFRHFCNKCKLQKPHSRRTATRDIVEMYVRRKTLMKKILGGKKQRLSLTTDIWVAHNIGASYMVITAHFVDTNWQLKKLIIGFKNVGDHKSVTIAAVLKECLEKWDIKKVFCITVDNATANSNAMEIFKADFIEVNGEESVVLNGDYLHVRCATHIINLIVRNGLQEVDKSVAAIRNGIQFVRSSAPRLKSFQLRVDIGKITRGSLALDLKTKWNSAFLMLNRAMDFKMAFDKMMAEDKPYNDYFQERVDGKKRHRPLAKDDWEVIDRQQTRQLCLLTSLSYS